jgi:hypothetical protein
MGNALYTIVLNICQLEQNISRNGEGMLDHLAERLSASQILLASAILAISLYALQA